MNNPQAKLPKLLSSVPLWIMVILGLMLVVPYFLLTPAPEPIPYSAFKAHLRLGHVEHVQISAHTIHGTLRPKNIDAPTPVQRFSTVRVEDPDLLRELEAQRVQYRGYYKSDTAQMLLLWFIPLSLLAGLYLYWTRRTDAGAGIIQFGKSRAHLHIESVTGVTFADCARYCASG